MATHNKLIEYRTLKLIKYKMKCLFTDYLITYHSFDTIKQEYFKFHRF